LNQTKAKSRNLLFVTGTRADYGKLEPLALSAVDDGHEVTFFVTGMHMMKKYGLTKEEVRRQTQFGIVEFINQRDGDPQDVILAKTILGFSDFLKEHQPDLVIIHGDRVEALACSLVCAINYTRCAHVEGGEVSGTIDELFRHCNTKLASAHLVSSDAARSLVEQLGEKPDTIHTIGSPELDIHSQPTGISLDEVLERYGILNRDYGVCVFHTVTSEQDSIADQAANLFQALIESGRYFVVILPNNDPGSDAIMKEIKTLPKERFRIIPSMRFKFFSELIRNSKAIIGNSSMGIREAPFFGVPSMDIGTRQLNRGKASSIWHSAAGDRSKIGHFLDRMWGQRFSPNENFGRGDAAQRFTELLEKEVFWKTQIQKNFFPLGR